MGRTLIIASGVRSGSTFIAESIAYHFQAVAGMMLFGLTKEHFDDLNNRSRAPEILRRLGSLWKNAEGWAATKIMCGSLSVMTRESRRKSELRSALFGPDTYWIVVRRRDRIRRAVSLAFAKRSGAWHVYENGHGTDCGMPTKIEWRAALEEILLDDVYLEALSESISPERRTEVFYEDFLSNPLPVCDRLGSVLGCTMKSGAVPFRDLTKIRPSDFDKKRRAVAEFKEWIRENHHAIGTPAEVAECESWTRTLRERIVEQFLRGRQSIRSLSRTYGIKEYLIRYWVEQHRHGDLPDDVGAREQVELLRGLHASLREKLSLLGLSRSSRR
jgi:transposase-like protein/LPS sulfotransferase NodH